MRVMDDFRLSRSMMCRGHEQYKRTIGRIGAELAQRMRVDHSDGRSLKPPSPRADRPR